MDHRHVLPALGTALGDGAVAEEEIVEVDQHRGIVEDDGQGHPVEGVAGDFSEQERPPFLGAVLIYPACRDRETTDYPCKFTV